MKEILTISEMLANSAKLALDDIKRWKRHAKSVLSKPASWGLYPHNRREIENAVNIAEDLDFYLDQISKIALELQKRLHGKFLSIEMLERVTTETYAGALLANAEANEAQPDYRMFDKPIIRSEDEVKSEWAAIQNDAEADSLLSGTIRFGDTEHE